MLILAFLLGFVINALGYIPPGNINLSVAQLAINKGTRQAYYFILAFSIVEVFFTIGMMRFARWMSSDVNLDVKVNGISLNNLVDFLMLAIFLIIGTITWINRNKIPNPKSQASQSKKGSVLYGIVLGVINPVQIPFWLFFGNYVILKDWIHTDYISLIIFSVGSGAGSALALYGYSYFARFIQEKFALSHVIMNKSIAIFLYSLAGILIVKNIFIFCL
ncbi:MAG: lysine transporter LysE [Pedobacter sp.]|nr:MAG: lysine transporter LysE [Pedobacter sp.]